MNFKDQVAADRAVFINLAEFGETHTVNGVAVDCVVDRNLARERIARRLNENTEGIWADALVIFAKQEDWPCKPLVGAKFTWDAKRVFYVTEVRLAGGIWSIEAGSNEA